MDLLMNGLLIAASLFAGGYCWVLGWRVKQLKSLDKGLGSAIVSLTRQVELARLTLEEARSSSIETSNELTHLISNAEDAAGKLRLMIAAAPSPHPGPSVRTGDRKSISEPHPKSIHSPHHEEIKLSSTSCSLAIDPQVSDDTAKIPHGEQTNQDASTVPKPRSPHPVAYPLRRFEAGTPAQSPARSEEDILESLTALAAGDH